MNWYPALLLSDTKLVVGIKLSVILIFLSPTCTVSIVLAIASSIVPVCPEPKVTKPLNVTLGCAPLASIVNGEA